MRLLSFSVKRGFRYCFYGFVYGMLLFSLMACSSSSRKDTPATKPVKTATQSVGEEETKVPTYNDLRGYMVPTRKSSNRN